MATRVLGRLPPAAHEGQSPAPVGAGGSPSVLDDSSPGQTGKAWGDKERLPECRDARQRSQVFHENEPLTPRGVAQASEIIPGAKGRHSQGGPEAKQGSFQEQLRDTAWLETPLVTKSGEAQMWLSGDLG